MTVFCRMALVAFCLAPGALYSQPAISGSVRDQSERPIPFCNVFVHKSDRLTKLVQTDEQGHYLLSPLDSGLYLFSVTSIGYKKSTQGIRLDDRPIVVDVVLQADTIVLDQVVVQDKGPIQVKGDTVVYDATYFKTGEEVALADLLKKLPGITVDDGGKVKFLGKEVSTVKVEDDDLFESNYPVLTKNLSADLVEQVEVLQNYSSNRLLKNIEDSEEVAVNVVLKKNRKHQLFGDGRMEANTNRYDGRLSLMSLAKKAKTYFLSAGNNTGSDPGGNAGDLLQSSNKLPGGEAAAEFLVPFAKPIIPEFKRDRYYFNNALLGSINVVLRPTKQLKVSLHALGYRDETEFFKAMRSEYYASSDTTRFDELSSTTNRESFGYLQAQVEYDASKNTSLRYRGKLDSHGDTTPQRNSLNLNEVEAELTSNTDRQDHLIAITRKLSTRSVVSLDLRYVVDRRPQHLLVNGNLLGDYFLPISTTDTLDQVSEFSNTFWLAQFSWFLRSGIGKVGVKGGYEHFAQPVETNLGSPPSTLSRNYINNSQGKVFAEAYYALTFGKWVLTPGIAWQRIDAELSNHSSNGFTFINPKLGARWRISEKNRFSAIYTIGQNTSTTTQLLANPILTDYNRITLTDDSIRSFATRSLLVTYEHGGWASGFSLFVNAYHQDAPSAYLTNTDLAPNYLVTTMNSLADRKLSSLSLTADQFLKAIKTNVKLSWNGSRAEFTTATEGISVPTVSFNQAWDGSLRTGLAGPFNVHGGLSVQMASTSSDLIYASNHTLLVYLDAYLNAWNRRLNVTAHWERYELASVSGRPVFYFVDLNARFTIKEGNGISVLLKGRNLLDENVFAQRFVSNQSVYTTTNRLIPRYILVGIEFRF